MLPDQNTKNRKYLASTYLTALKGSDPDLLRDYLVQVSVQMSPK